MVDQVKDMQRSDPMAKEQWYAYCETYGDNVRDPAKHDATFINSFISQYQSGARLEFKEGAELIKMIKMGQKKSQAWKGVWEAYCNNSPVDGKPAYDPAKHDSAFLEGFFDFVGKMAMMGSMGMMSGGMKKGPMSTGDAQKDILIAKIKAFQKQGEAQKQTWHGFCDQSLGGVYDPSRHDAATLQMFVQSNGIQDIAIPAGVGMGMMGGMGASSPLVLKIKNYQKMGEAEKNTWHTYCDTNLGGVRDPGRHDPAELQKFITNYGVA